MPGRGAGRRGLAEDVRHYGRWMRDEAEKRIGHLYPPVEITPAVVRERPDLKPYAGPEADGHRVAMGADGEACVESWTRTRVRGRQRTLS